MERWLVHFLQMRNRARGPPELQARAERCLWIVARADGASDAELDRLEAEVERLEADIGRLRRELAARRNLRRRVLH